MRLISSKQAASILGISPGTLENWRVRGYGPPYIKISNLVKYEEGAVYEWIGKQTTKS